MLKCKSSFGAIYVESKYSKNIDKIYISGGSDKFILKAFECLNLSTNRWEILENMIYSREEHGFSLGVDGKLYAIGGFNGKECLKEVECYNITRKQWKAIKPLTCPRRSLCSICLPDGIYVIGGYDGNHYLSSVEKFSIQTKYWTTISSMRYPKCAMGCICSPEMDSKYV